MSTFRGKVGASGTLSVPVVSSVAFSRVALVHSTSLLAAPSATAPTVSTLLATTPLVSGFVSPLGFIDGGDEQEH